MAGSLHLPGRHRAARWELLGLRAHRVDLARRCLEVLEVHYEAGRFGRGYKNRPKSAASIRVVPLAGPVADAIARQLPKDCPPSTLVFAGPGGSNGIPAGTRTLLTRDNLRRAYHTAVTRVADPVAKLGYTPRRVLLALRDCGPGQTAETLRGHLRSRLPTTRTIGTALGELEAAGLVVRHAVGDGESPLWSVAEPPRDDPFAGLKLRGPMTYAIRSRPGWRTPASRPG